MFIDVKVDFDVEVTLLLNRKVVHISKQCTNTCRMKAGGREVVRITISYNSEVMVPMEVEGRELRNKGQKGNLIEKTIPINIRDKSPDPVSWEA